MVREINPLERRTLELIRELFGESAGKAHCPNIGRDEHGRPYCAKGLTYGDNIPESHRRICDTASLQLWCLDKRRYIKCIFFNGEPFEE
jgi:hypothetical protein